MAICSQSHTKCNERQSSERFNSLCVIWLNNDSKSHQSVEEKLRDLGHHFIKFQEVTQCQKYIEKVSEGDRLMLLTTNSLGRKLTPLIHRCHQVLLIYIYYDDRRTDERWAGQYEKVRTVATNVDDLASQIRLNFRISKQAEESSSSNIFTASGRSTNGRSTLEVAGEFVYFQTLIDCLQRMKPNEQDTDELKRYLERQPQSNQSMLDKFYRTYSPDKVISWYTAQPFFYDTINTALRKQDIYMMFLYRSFLADMYQQLSKYQLQCKTTVYRGQSISKHELETLKKSIGKLIATNSFLSTSVDREVAAFFANSQGVSDDMVPVLFEIVADPLMVDTKPFADIAKLSKHPEEHEILFMFGSIFRVSSVDKWEESAWIIRMSLCDDDDPDVQEVLKYMQQQNGKGETNLQTLSKLLWKMARYDLATEYFERFLRNLSPEDPLRLSVYEDMAAIKSQCGDFNGSIDLQRKILQWKQLYDTSYRNKTRIPTIHSNARWTREAITVAGGQGLGMTLSQLSLPDGLFVDHEGTAFIADWWNNRIVASKQDASGAYVVMGNNGNTSGMEELFRPSDVLMDKDTNSFIISDNGKRRVIRLFRENSLTRVETIIDNIFCWGLALDNEGSLYVTDLEKHAVRRYRKDEKMTTGTIIAGDHGQGNRFNQLDTPLYVFVDSERAIYVSDHGNHRVMKWIEGASEGILVAGGSDAGEDLAHLWCPSGIQVDQQGTIYVADSLNHRVVRWHKEARRGESIVGGHGQGERAYQLNEPKGLAFDHLGNLYVVDKNNHRVQRFSIA